MKIADEILKDNGLFLTNFISSSGYDAAIKAINTARKEALYEAVQIVVKDEVFYRAILKLIDELK